MFHSSWKRKSEKRSFSYNEKNQNRSNSYIYYINANELFSGMQHIDKCNGMNGLQKIYIYHLYNRTEPILTSIKQTRAKTTKRTSTARRLN